VSDAADPGSAPGPPGPAVLLLAQAPDAAGVKLGLESRLGPQGRRRLQAILLKRAVRWASGVDRAAVVLALAGEPGAAARGVLELGAEVEVIDQAPGTFGERLAGAMSRVGDHDRPLLVASCDVPGLRVEHAEAALEDLEDGCDVSFGPSSDGGCYLLGLARPDPDLIARSVGAWRRGELMARALEALAANELSVGLLRSERELHSDADAQALLADPTAPAEVVEVLAGRA
jgi:hypothetical protein